MSATMAESRGNTAVVEDIAKDEQELLEIYRRAKKMGYADLAVTVQEGKRVKLWLTEKFR